MQQALAAQELADRIGGTLRHCPPDRLLTEVRPLQEAGPGSVSFLASPKHRDKALQCQAGLIIVESSMDLGEQPQLVVAKAYWGFAQATGLLQPEPAPEFSEGPIHPSAKLGPGCRLAYGVTVGARSVLGAGCVLHPGVHIAEDCVVGDHCEFYPGVVLYRRTQVGHRVRIHANTVLGSDGYAYVTVNGIQEKIPQAGWVEVGDDVEIGGATVVDRGGLGPTRIRLGAKVDNLCHISHNVEIGEHDLIAAQAGIAGSASLGHHVTFGGKVGVVGHVHIGSGSVCAGNAMVGKDLPENSFVSGFLARPHKEWLATQAALNRLPELMKELRKR